MTEKRILPTQFRLTDRERDFLLLKGRGNLAAGFRDVMRKAGYRYSPENDRAARELKVRRDFNFDRDEFCYLRLEDEKVMRSLSVSLAIEHDMMMKFGKNYYFTEAILKGLFPLQEELEKIDRIKEIIDLVGNQVIWKKTCDLPAVEQGETAL